MSQIHHTATPRQTDEDSQHEGPSQALADMRLASIRPCWALEPEARMGKQRAKPPQGRRGTWPLSFWSLVGAPWE